MGQPVEALLPARSDPCPEEGSRADTANGRFCPRAFPQADRGPATCSATLREYTKTLVEPHTAAFAGDEFFNPSSASAPAVQRGGPAAPA